jgi:hypothetical protein
MFVIPPISLALSSVVMQQHFSFNGMQEDDNARGSGIVEATHDPQNGSTLNYDATAPSE